VVVKVKHNLGKKHSLSHVQGSSLNTCQINLGIGTTSSSTSKTRDPAHARQIHVDKALNMLSKTLTSNLEVRAISINLIILIFVFTFPIALLTTAAVRNLGTTNITLRIGY